MTGLLLFMWNYSGTLTLLFALLAGLSILGSRLQHNHETYGDHLRREALERGRQQSEPEEEDGDSSAEDTDLAIRCMHTTVQNMINTTIR
jgi:hypothetical protein